MTTNGYAVVLLSEEEGEKVFPNLPNPQGFPEMRVEFWQEGQADPAKYVCFRDGILSFTTERGEAHAFETVEAAQAAINMIPSMVQPAGLSIQPLGD